jgi:hypothetical protein
MKGKLQGPWGLVDPKESIEGVNHVAPITPHGLFRKIGESKKRGGA